MLNETLIKSYAEQDMVQDQNTYAKLKANHFRPDEINVQISRRCNLNCYMCGYEIWGRNKGVMPIETFELVVEQCVDYGIPKLSFTSAQGEPLLNNRAEEYIHVALDAGLITHLNTNCTTLGDHNIFMLVEAAGNSLFSVQASFSGYDKTSHEEVYVGSKFEDTSRKLQKCYLAFVAAGCKSSFTINGIIKDDKQKHLDYLASLGIDPMIARMEKPDNFAGIVKIGTRDGTHGIYTYRTDLPLRSLRLCQMLAHMLVVYDDGEVSACACRDSENVMNIGNVLTETLEQMRNGERYHKFLNAFMARNIDGMKLCMGCDIPYG